MKRYHFYHTAKYNGCWYHAGSVYVLDSDSANALIGFCVAEGEPIPALDDKTTSEMVQQSRRRCAQIEAEKAASELEARRVKSEARQTLRRIAALDADVDTAVDEFETEVSNG